MFEYKFLNWENYEQELLQEDISQYWIIKNVFII